MTFNEQTDSGRIRQYKEELSGNSFTRVHIEKKYNGNNSHSNKL